MGGKIDFSLQFNYFYNASAKSVRRCQDVCSWPIFDDFGTGMKFA
jgi:hypothetical protein